MMTFPRRFVPLFPALFALHGLATDIMWDGDGTPGAGGDWSTDANWDGDAVPTTSDRAILPSVTDGMRTVSQDSPEGTTANALLLVQTGTTGTNRLGLAGNLTLSKGSREADPESSTTSAFQVSRTDGAATEQIVVDLNGNRIRFTSGGGSSICGGNLGGTINFNAEGSAIEALASNTHMKFYVFGHLNATANGRLGANPTTSTGNGYITLKSNSSLTVAPDVTFAFDILGGGSQDRTFDVYNAGTVEVSAGAILQQRWPVRYNKGNILFSNSGTLRQAGSLQFRVRWNSGGDATTTLSDSGEWTISGTGADIVRLTTAGVASYISIPQVALTSSGVLRGSGSDDILEFNEEVADGTRRMPVSNGGSILPGAGSQGIGMDSVGTLRLRDIDVTQAATGMVVLDLGGVAEGEYDRLCLETGTTDPTGAGTLDLTAGGTLQLHTVNGFAPTRRFTLPLIEAGRVVGEFATVQLDGEPFSGNQLVVAKAGTYTLEYTGEAISLDFTPDTNPTTVVLLH